LRSHDLKQKAYDLGVRLERMKGTAARDEGESVHARSSVAIIAGHQVFAALERLVGRARRSTPGNLAGLVPHHARQCFLGKPGRRTEAGVGVRVITSFTPKIIEPVRKYSREIEIRHSDEMSRGIRFSIFDRTRVTLALTEPTGSQEDARMMCSTIPTLAREPTFRFEQMWSGSKSAAQWRGRECQGVSIR
jgi:hypothetical protein